MITAPPKPARHFLDWPDRWWWALIFLATLLVYSRALGGALLWDDGGHVTRADLRSLNGLWRIWFEPGATQQYYPLLHSAFWFEHHLWGDATFGYHLVNVLLHATSACLFATLLRRLAVPGAWLAAALFAVHPVCVESVAWISEQKNTLSTALALGAALAYLRFDASRRPSDFARASGLFLAALLAKTVVATLPGALLVLIAWRRGRLSFSRDFLPLVPWFLVGAGLGIFTASFEQKFIGATGADFALGAVERGLLAGRVVWFYAGKILWPAQLIFIYPRWTVDSLALWQWLFPLGGLGLLATLWFWKKRGLLAGALIFGGTLFPVLGFVNAYPFIFSFVADHFQYAACLGLLAPLGAGLALGLGRLPRATGLAVCAVLFAVLGILTWRQCGMYRDVFALYETTLAKNPACWMAHNNLALDLAASGRVDEAVTHLEAALQFRPNYAEAENNLGHDLIFLGRSPDAIPHLEHALHLQAAYPEAHGNLGIALMNTGHPAEGIAHMREALRLNPNLPVTHCDLGLALGRNGRADEAIAEFREAARLDPGYADAELNWGIGLAVTGHPADALPHVDRAIELGPDNPEPYVAAGRVLASLGRLDEAIARYQRAVLLNPNHADAHLQLALALRQAGRMDEANLHYAEAQRLQSGAPGGRE